MIRNRRILPFVLLLTLVACRTPTSTSGSTTAADPLLEQYPELDEQMPFDPNVRKGTLDNGMTWYVEQKSEPRERVQLWVAVRVGAVHEDDDQLGLAHYVEHMAFNGTEHFPKNDLIKYLESIGTKFGAHLNAHTSFEETVYKLQVPTDDAEILDKGFLVLRDWAGRLAFTDEEMNKERGVVLEEWRRGRGASGRARDVMVPIWFHGARHADRLPIGKEEILQNFELDAARRFYRDWYRPDLMAVFVVGDIDPDAMQAKIAETFGDFENPAEPRERVQYEIPVHEEALYGVHPDPEQPYSLLQVVTKRASVEGTTIRDYRDTYIGRLATRVIAERFGDLSKKPDAPFLQAGLSRRRMTPVAEQDAAYAVARDGQVEASLKAVLVEVERLKRHGVTEAELARAKANVLKGLEKSFNERAKENSRSALQELLRNFTNGEQFQGIEWEYEALQRYLPGITVAEVNASAATMLTGSGYVVMATVPEKEGVPVPTEESLKGIVDAVAAMDIAPPAAEEAAGDLLAELPAPGSVVSKTRDEVNDLDVWTLSNGVTVLVKPTDFKDDEILIRGWAFGGHALASDDGYIPAATANSVRRSSGVGPFTASQLTKWLAGRNASVNVNVGEITKTARATTTPDDLEVAMQLLYAHATAPRFDADGFELAKQNGKEWSANREANPNTAFNDAANRLLWNDHLRTRPWTPETYDAMDREASEAFHAARTANWGGAVFGVVGKVDPATLEPLVAQYLATLPTGDVEAVGDVGKRRAPAAASETITQGLEPKARVKLTFPGEFESKPETRHALRMLGKWMSFRLREVLREDLGGTYSVGARVSDRFHPVSDYAISIDFQCDPERVDELTAAALGVVDEVLGGPPAIEYATKIIEQERRSLEEDKRKNSFWLNALLANRRRAEPLDALAIYWSLHDAITPESLHAAATTYIDRDRVLRVVLVPEAAPEGAPEKAE